MKIIAKNTSTLSCFILSLICAIPLLGVLVGAFIVAPSLIGSSMRYGKSPAIKTSIIIIATSICYVIAATLLIVNGFFVGSFFAACLITFVGLKATAYIENQFSSLEHTALNKSQHIV